MAVSNYPNGFTGGITIREVPIQIAHPGKVFWVNNSSVLAPGGIGGSNGNDGSYRKPFSTIDYAIGRCTANRGDILMVMPGHAETLSTASAITCDVAGIAIVGLGTGAKVPTLTWGAAAATCVISAANCSFYNLKFVNNFADVATQFSLTADADGTTWDSCYFTDTSTILNCISFVTAATGANDLAFINCRAVGKSASNDYFFTGVAHDMFRMDKCQIQFDVAQTAAAGLLYSTGNMTNVWIKDTAFRSNVDGAAFIDFNGAANSGTVSWCTFSSIDGAGAVTAGFDMTGAHCFECYVAGEDDSFGLVGGGTVYNNA